MNGYAMRTGGVALVMWLGVTGPALAEDPKEAARILGEAGQAAAAAIAKDSGQPSAVPGYAGTDLPEAAHTDTGMADAASRALTDPDDEGDAVGRAVVEGTVSRPDAPVSQGEPAVVRSKAVSDDPQSPAWGGQGLASGSTSDCGADLDDAGGGGSCGQLNYCVGAGCETVETPANTGFVEAATRANMALEMGGETFDRNNLRIFAGNKHACRIKWGGLANCCKDSGFIEGLAGCNREERYLAEQRHDGNTRYLGKRCTKKFFGWCRRYVREWCVFRSKLGRIVHEQGRPQLGIGWGSCRGFTVAEIERVDFERMNLSEFTGNLFEADKDPGVDLPDSGETGAVMRERIRNFYSQGN